MIKNTNIKFSIITVCYNSERTIERTIRSVSEQSYKNYEHLIIDGSSTDSTIERVSNFASPNIHIFSEADKGIYDAMNKGFKRAQGDVVAFLNSDDYYYNDQVLELVARGFSDSTIDFVYGDILMLDSNQKLTRHWRTNEASGTFLKYSQIPHPGLFVRKVALMKIDGPFDSTYLISADLKQQLLLINKLSHKGFRISSPVAFMSLGGESTKNMMGYVTGWRESVRAYNEVFGSGGFVFTFGKVLSKFSQFVNKR